MIPATLSATSVHVAELCMGRWEVEMFNRTKAPMRGTAATLGSSCHGALEDYVKFVYLERKEQPSIDLMMSLWRIHYKINFGPLADERSVEFTTGRKLLQDWHKRTVFDGHTVLSAEQKEFFILKSRDGKNEVQFNYILDRFDQLKEDEFEVVDYKSNVMPVGADELRRKLQARVYALAMQIKYPTARRIWVTFDMLRFGQTSVAFDRADNIATFRRLQDAFQMILDTPEGDAPHELNSECLFCPIKTTCPEVTRSINLGSVLSIQDLEKAADLRALLDYQEKAAKAAKAELDTHIMTIAAGTGQVVVDTGLTKMTFSAKRTRSISGHATREIVGDDIFAQYGKEDITVGAWEELKKDPRLTPEQVTALDGIVGTNVGDPYVVTKTKQV